MTTYANVPAFFSAAHGAQGNVSRVNVSRESVLCHERDAAVAHAAKFRKVLGDERDTAVALAAKLSNQLCYERDAAVALAAKLRKDLCDQRDALVALTPSSLSRSQCDKRDARDYAVALMAMQREASAVCQAPALASVRYVHGNAAAMFPRVVSRIQAQNFAHQLIVETRRRSIDKKAGALLTKFFPDNLMRTLQAPAGGSPEDLARRYITAVELAAFASKIATDTRRKFIEDESVLKTRNFLG